MVLYLRYDLLTGVFFDIIVLKSVDYEKIRLLSDPSPAYLSLNMNYSIIAFHSWQIYNSCGMGINEYLMYQTSSGF